MTPYPNTTKEELEEYDRKVKENVEKYYKDRFWSTLAKNLKEESEASKYTFSKECKKLSKKFKELDEMEDK